MEFTQTFHSSGHGLMRPSEQKEEQRSVHDIKLNKSGHTVSEFRQFSHANKFKGLLRLFTDLF